ncbi:MAG: outer membrane protein assembly factor, partial [Chitinophagia bacterium]|nr:outer membrane protein assembly factor [Chitinophagia bacterium]
MHKFFLFTGLFILVVSTAPVYAQLGGNKGGGLNRGAQTDAGVDKPKEYEIGGIRITGNTYLDADLIEAVTNLSVGQKVTLPNDEGIAKAIKGLWKQELFSNINIVIERYIDDKIFLNIVVEERPRLSSFRFKNIRVAEAKEVKAKLPLVTNKVVTEATKKEATERIKKYYIDKGYGKVEVLVEEKPDTLGINKVMLTFTINKGSKTHINQINIVGATSASEQRLKKTLKSTKETSRLTLNPDKMESVYPAPKRSFGKYVKQWGFLYPSRTLEALEPYFRFKFFASSKYNQQKFETDKQAMVNYLNTLGYRDAAIVRDTVYQVENGNVNIDIEVKEGNRYYFGDITWKGNTKYSSEALSKVLGIKKGDVYNQQLLESRIGRQVNPDGGDDVSSLYMDDGYLFFNIEPIEASIVNDTINYEMRITEGTQATIRDITIFGNDRTNEHVIRRELRTIPGNKFSRSDLIRSNREIAQLGFFDQEKIGIQPKPNQSDGTVDIEYTVVEKSSDQLQLSAGFGGGVNFYGNVGISFNNFSMRNILKPRKWDPLPVGDGQKFAINYASNGAYYNSLSTSFTEPWLGGKKPNSFTTQFTYSKYSGAASGTSPSSSFLRLAGGGVSLGKRLKWPDNWFIFNYGVFFNNYRLKQYALISDFNEGYANDFHIKLVLARNSIDQPLYPRSGANVQFTFQATPPFSAFSGKDYAGETNSTKYKWIEYHKYKFIADFYQRVGGNFVLRLAGKYGFLGYYNKGIGYSPFERFQLGGDGLSGYSNFIGRDIIAQRGYEVYNSSAVIYNKYTMELR